MKQVVQYILLLSLAFLVGATPCLAKAKGYLYAVGYSVAQKKVYLSSIIIQKVRNISYSDEEFVTEVELIQKMEAQFLKHLVATERINPTAYTTTARGPYKSNAIADRRLNAEKEQFTKKGYSIMVLSDFEYDD